MWRLSNAVALYFGGIPHFTNPRDKQLGRELMIENIVPSGKSGVDDLPHLLTLGTGISCRDIIVF